MLRTASWLKTKHGGIFDRFNTNRRRESEEKTDSVPFDITGSTGAGLIIWWRVYTPLVDNSCWSRCFCARAGGGLSASCRCWRISSVCSRRISHTIAAVVSRVLTICTAHIAHRKRYDAPVMNGTAASGLDPTTDSMCWLHGNKPRHDLRATTIRYFGSLWVSL